MTEPLQPNNSPGGDAQDDPFLIQMERFSGPLDLLLHLIREHELDVFDIPVAFITEKYLSYLMVIQELNLDRAGDFIVMAATLAHIKSKMLLPSVDMEDEEGEPEEVGDPREELVRRLLEYQKYRDAAEKLGSRPLLNRDEYVRPPDRSLIEVDDDVDVEDVSVFQLIEIFQDLLDKAKAHSPHQVQLDSVSVEDRIREVLTSLSESRRVAFRDLFANAFTRPELVATLLAVLELARLSVLRIFQTSEGGEIYLSRRADAPDDEAVLQRITLTYGGETIVDNDDV